MAIAIEVDEAEDAGNQVGDARREARAEDAEAEVCEEQVVEARVRQARKHGDDEALYRPSVCDEEGVEENHERGEREERQQRVEVAAAVRHELRRGAEQHEQAVAGGNRQRGQCYGEHGCRHGDHREALARELRLVLAEILGDKSRAARGQHDGEAEDDVDGGVDDIGGGQRVAAGIAPDEDAIRHRVERDDDHHADGRRGKAQQAAEPEPAGER